MQLLETELIDFYLVKQVEDIHYLINLFEDKNLIAVDSEVYALHRQFSSASNFDPHTSRIRLLQSNYLGNKVPFVLDLFELGIEGALPFVRSIQDKEVVAHSMAYDFKQILSTFGVKLNKPRCTKVAMQRLGICTGYKSSLMRTNTLKALARDYWDIHLDKDLAESDWSADTLSIEQYSYAALDVGATKSSDLSSVLLQSWELLLETLEADPPYGYGVKEAHDIDQLVMRELALIEYRGMPVNKEMIRITQETNRRLLSQKKLTVCKHLGLPVEVKMELTEEGPEPVLVVSEAVSRLLNNPKALVDIINNKLPTPLTDTKSESLERILKELEKPAESEEEDIKPDSELVEDQERDLRAIEIVNDLLDYKTLLKACGTDYLSLINEVTGKLHSSYQVDGTSTGRMSSGGRKERSFNCQQLSKVETVIEIEDPFYCEGIIL